MSRALLVAALFACACNGGTSTPTDDTDTDTDTDTIETDTDTMDSDTDVDTDVIDTDTDTDVADTDTDTDTDTDADTDDGLLTVEGQMWCVVNNIPAQPSIAEITVGEAVVCQPLGGGCNGTGALVLEHVNATANGRFRIRFDPTGYTLDQLYLHTNTTDGVCGNGYQFTQQPLSDIADLTDVQVEVYSIFF
ncbi:MAG: hypothetical protein H6733_17355 [Alphaproteobacteria bacterium]|nr:hypothetical protein [Alphaproteobacteria bacterium]